MVIISAPPPTSCTSFLKSSALAAARHSSTASTTSSTTATAFASRSSFVFSGSSNGAVTSFDLVLRAAAASSKSVRGMAEFGDVNQRRDSTTAAAAALEASGSSSSCSTSDELSLPLNFVDFRSEEEMLYGIRKAAESGRISLNISRSMEELYQNYRNAVFKSGDSKAPEVALSNMSMLFDRIFVDVKDPFEFSSYHKAIREPFDYYTFGQNYIRPLIDFRNSYIGNLSLFDDIRVKLQRGENIVMMSNHQTEADPAVIALLLESTHPDLAENMIYVAGDRVITDPLCKPFSMGRNLLCVYSKKHMNDVPALADMKRRANTKSLKEMALLLRAGSALIWIAPSGGRDRPDPHTGEWYPAQFDLSSVDNMRRLVEHAGVPGHLYPLAILCHDIMPPPLEVEKEIGEKRVISFHGTGLSVGAEIDFHDLAASLDDPEKAKTAYTHALYDSVTEQYEVLKYAVHGKQGLEASIPSVLLSQPWQ
ncbi:OLC1v1031201C1 [Oldenlandia corymbosa var. corymbosa]|uniref:glycerol-3-phosphate 1-O-acyltransferase n=1 Tax=Oldenlandia corymbosa var. corymbosa TaxID=529605 RepID=A0AAV1CKW5_OLDCO|nr:OLC1v1031201C1 [Oldenlandia corymbosa var. corymbosa]